MTLKQEYEKQYHETVELLKLLGRAGGVACDLQLTAFRRTCQLAVAYGKVSAGLLFNKPTDTQCQSEKENNKSL